MLKSEKPTIAAIILAAGKGTRMKSALPKVLHCIGEKPMLLHVTDILSLSGIKETCLILNPELELFMPFLNEHRKFTVCLQMEQRGTADAVASAANAFPFATKPHYSKSELFVGSPLSAPYTLICCGDTPALDSKIISDFIHCCLKNRYDLGVIGAIHPSPTGYGRLLLDSSNNLIKIVEEKDADQATKKINLINTGVIFVKTVVLFQLLDLITPNNMQKEYYLTDCFELASQKNIPTYVYQTNQYQTFSGINTPEQLKELEVWMNKNAHQ